MDECSPVLIDPVTLFSEFDRLLGELRLTDEERTDLTLRFAEICFSPSICSTEDRPKDIFYYLSEVSYSVQKKRVGE